MLLYYITDRTQFPGDESTRQARLLGKIAEAADSGVNYIQLREKDLPPRELERLARQAVEITSGRSRILINSRTDIAISAGADGVHLPSNYITPSEVRKIWTQCGARALARELSPKIPLISVSCHSAEEISSLAEGAADLVLAAPVFEKRGSPKTQPIGLQGLGELCRHNVPVLALGGITLQNAGACVEAGAAGIAAIRLFQQNSIAEVARKLHQGS